MLTRVRRRQPMYHTEPSYKKKDKVHAIHKKTPLRSLPTQKKEAVGRKVQSSALKKVKYSTVKKRTTQHNKVLRSPGFRNLL